MICGSMHVLKHVKHMGMTFYLGRASVRGDDSTAIVRLFLYDVLHQVLSQCCSWASVSEPHTSVFN